MSANKNDRDGIRTREPVRELILSQFALTACIPYRDDAFKDRHLVPAAGFAPTRTLRPTPLEGATFTTRSCWQYV